MPEFNATLAFVLVSFIIFMLIMKAVFFDPILKLKAQREQQLLQDRETAKRSDEQHDSLMQDYEANLQKARREAQQVLQNLREEAKTKSSTIISDARVNAQAHLDREMAALAESREQAYQELESERRHLKQIIISKVVKEHSGVLA
jgi:F-type H+-transporting ATPase subunit b